jgi:hypothetical protein
LSRQIHKLALILKIFSTTGRKLQMLKTICIDAEKTKSVTPIQKQFISERPIYQTLSFDELQLIKNTDFTDIEQLKEFKDKPIINERTL